MQRVCQNEVEKIRRAYCLNPKSFGLIITPLTQIQMPFLCSTDKGDNIRNRDLPATDLRREKTQVFQSCNFCVSAYVHTMRDAVPPVAAADCCQPHSSHPRYLRRRRALPAPV